MKSYSLEYYRRHSDPSWTDRLGDWNSRSENYDEEEEGALRLWLTALTCLIEVFDRVLMAILDLSWQVRV